MESELGATNRLVAGAALLPSTSHAVVEIVGSNQVPAHHGPQFWRRDGSRDVFRKKSRVAMVSRRIDDSVAATGDPLNAAALVNLAAGVGDLIAELDVNRRR